MAMTKKEREHVERLEKLIEQQAATIEALLLNTPAPIVTPVSCGCPCHWPRGATIYSCWCSCNRTITWVGTRSTIDPIWDFNVTFSGNEITGVFA